MKWNFAGNLYFTPRSAEYQANVAAQYAELHARGAVHRTKTGIWIVSGYDACRAALLSKELPRIHPALNTKTHVDIASSPSITLLTKSLFGNETPHDFAIRAAIKGIFTKSNIETHRATARGWAQALLERLARQSVVEAVHDLALPFTMRVLTVMLGLPEAHKEQLWRLTDDTIALVDAFPASQAAVERANASVAECYDLFASAIATAQPAPMTLASEFRRMVEAGELGTDTAVANLAITFSAGYETTVSQIVQTLALLSSDLAARNHVMALGGDFEAVIEEAVRLASPLQFVGRTVKSDFMLADRALRAGDDVLIFLAAANRDPVVFEDPNRFRLDRPAMAKSLGFGLGIHRCVGEYLGRLHVAVLVETILQRYPGFFCTHEPTHWRPTVLFRSPTDAMLQFHTDDFRDAEAGDGSNASGVPI